MKTTTKFKKIMSMVILCLGLNAITFAQCNVSFTYTVGSAGLVNFTNTTTGVSSGVHYSWGFDSQNGSNATSPSYTYPFNGVYIVSLAATDSLNNCYSSTTQTITITNAQTAPPCQSAFTYTIGSGGLVNFTNTSSTYTATATNYDWNFGDNNQDYTASPSYTYYYNGTYTVSLNVNNPYSNCTDVSSQVLTISNAATLPACTSSFTYTLGSTGQASFTSNYTGNPNNINWSFGGQGTSTSYTYQYNGVYNVTCTINDSLANCFSSTSNTVSITNTATQPCLPTVSFFIRPDSLNIGMGIWDINPTYSSQVSSAVWSWGDGSSTAGWFPSHTYASAGWYNICVKVYSQCGDSSTTCQNDSVYRRANTTAGSMVTVNVMSLAAGVKNNSNEINTVKLYPNPFSDNLTINFNSASSSAITYSIFDLYGKQVAQEKVSVEKGENNINVNTSSFSNGMYFVNITDNTNKKTQTLKIVK